MHFNRQNDFTYVDGEYQDPDMATGILAKPGIVTPSIIL